MNHYFYVDGNQKFQGLHHLLDVFEQPCKITGISTSNLNWWVDPGFLNHQLRNYVLFDGKKSEAKNPPDFPGSLWEGTPVLQGVTSYRPEMSGPQRSTPSNRPMANGGLGALCVQQHCEHQSSDLREVCRHGFRREIPGTPKEIVGPPDPQLHPYLLPFPNFFELYGHGTWVGWLGDPWRNP